MVKILQYDAGKFRADLIEYRSSKKINRVEFAKQTGIGINIVQCIENDYRIPRADIFITLCKMMEKEPMDYFK